MSMPATIRLAVSEEERARLASAYDETGQAETRTFAQPLQQAHYSSDL